MKKKHLQPRTLSVHAGSSGDPQFGGTVTPLFPSAAYDYRSGNILYPRYFNTPNHRAVAEKMAALEKGEDALTFSSGMAAIFTSMMALLRAGDHAVFQNDLYGGTHHAVLNELNRYGIEYTLVDASHPANFEKAVKKNTRILYVETPSNPLLKITDLPAVVKIARRQKLITLIDNTFASPVNQNPLELGIDIVLHSGTKYIGGHSDLMCGVVVSSKKYVDIIKQSAIHFGGHADAYTCWLVERSLKTLYLRVHQQNDNAQQLAEWLSAHKKIARVYYPGLKSHPGHAVAKNQMSGFGGMLSFDVKGDADRVVNRLELIKPAVSLGGVESTINQPHKTSHRRLTSDERKAAGITDKLLRLSTGVEDVNDLMKDLDNALK
ncbi:MAG: PLP-dependent aspartate aminotransferase family protein [Cyclobacteriaceae bacterium]|nr:PLP-dependent aspartate aminotransferase family protein [Cyclobacteriaceae bacterium]